MIEIIRYFDGQIAIRSGVQYEMVNESLVRQIEQGRLSRRFESLSAVQYLVLQDQLPDPPSALHVEQYNRVGDTVVFVLSDGRTLLAGEMEEEPYRTLLASFLEKHPDAIGDVEMEIEDDEIRDDQQYWFKVFGSDHFEPAYKFEPDKIDRYYRVRLNPNQVQFGRRWVRLETVEKNLAQAMERFIRDNDVEWFKLNDEWIRAEDLTPDQFLAYLRETLAVRRLVWVQTRPGSFLPEVDLGAIQSVDPTTFLVQLQGGLSLEFETVAKTNPSMLKRYAQQQEQPFRSTLLDRLHDVTTPQISNVVLTFTTPDGSEINTIETSVDFDAPPAPELYRSMQFQLDNGNSVLLDRVKPRALQRFTNNLDEAGRVNFERWVGLERDRLAALKAARAKELQERREQLEISFDLCGSGNSGIPYAKYEDVRSFVDSVLGAGHDDIAKQTYEYLVLIEWGYVTNRAKDAKLRDTFKSFFKATWDPVLDETPSLDRIDVFYRVLCALQKNQGVLRLLEREEALGNNENEGKFWDYSLKNDARIEGEQDQVYARMMRDIKREQYRKRTQWRRGVLLDDRSNLEMLREINMPEGSGDSSVPARDYLLNQYDKLVAKRRRIVPEEPSDVMDLMEDPSNVIQIREMEPALPDGGAGQVVTAAFVPSVLEESNVIQTDEMGPAQRDGGPEQVVTTINPAVEAIQEKLRVMGMDDGNKVEEWVTDQIPWQEYSPFVDQHYAWTPAEWRNAMASLTAIFDETISSQVSGLQSHQRFIKMLTSPASPFHRVLFMHEMGTGKTLASICSTALWWVGSFCQDDQESVNFLLGERDSMDATFMENLNQQLYRPEKKRKRKDPLEITYDDGVLMRLFELSEQLNRCGPLWIRSITVVTKIALQTNWKNDLSVAANGLCLQGEVKLQFCTIDELIKEEKNSSNLKVEKVEKETLYRVDYTQFNNKFLNNCIVIVDEAQLYMSENIQSTKDKQVFQELLRKYTFRTPCLFLLSATPIQNNPIELGQMYNILNPFGYRVKDKEGIFRMAQFSSESSQGFGQYKSGEDDDGTLDGLVQIKDIEPKLAEFSSAWRGFCSFKGLVEGIPTRLPDKTVEVEMTERQYEIYNEAKASGKQDVAYYAVTIASLYYEDDHGAVVSPKFDKALELILANQRTLCSLSDGQKVPAFTLVFCGYIEKGVATFEEFLKQHGWTKYTKRNTSAVGSERRFAVLTGNNSKDAGELADAANRGLFNVLVMSEVGSEGLNLNLCSQVIFLTIQFQPTSTDQIIGRCLRKTSKPTTVQVVFLISVAPKDVTETVTETVDEMGNVTVDVTADVTADVTVADRSRYNFVLNKRKLFKPWYNAIKDASFECNEVYAADRAREYEIETMLSNMVTPSL